MRQRNDSAKVEWTGRRLPAAPHVHLQGKIHSFSFSLKYTATSPLSPWIIDQCKEHRPQNIDPFFKKKRKERKSTFLFSEHFPSSSAQQETLNATRPLNREIKWKERQGGREREWKILLGMEREILLEVGMRTCKGQNIIAIRFHLLSSNRSCEANNTEGGREKTREGVCVHVHYSLQRVQLIIKLKSNLTFYTFLCMSFIIKKNWFQ